MTRRKRPDHAIDHVTEVPLHLCDPLGVVWHGRYFEWLEVAREKLFAKHDLEVHQIRALGHRMYITEATCRYMRPLVYGDRVRITAWFPEVEPLIRVAYDIYHDESGRWSGRARTLLATTDVEGRLLARTPDALLERLPRR